MEGETGKAKSASFCVPRAAIEALLDAKATAYEICAYLILAKFTDASGIYTPASVASVYKYTGGNKDTIKKVIERLLTIRAKKTKKVSNERSGKSHAFIDQAVDLGPIIYSAADWLEKTGEILPDGPTKRGAIRFVLPDFGEEMADRVWFGAGLVDGFGTFTKPMKRVKDGGDEMARLLLIMYANTDMESWGGVNPHKCVWREYTAMNEATIKGGGRLIRAEKKQLIAQIDPRVGDTKKYWDTLTLLESHGLFYEAVLVLNRNGEKRKFPSGGDYLNIPADAEPLYELGARGHGYTPDGEQGLGAITTNTAGHFDQPVGTDSYAAIVRRGQGAMIVGIYRPRFRVSNPKNDGVIRAWSRIRENNAEAVEFIQAIRQAKGLEPYAMPSNKPKPKTAAKADQEPPACDKAARAAEVAAMMAGLAQSLSLNRREE